MKRLLITLIAFLSAATMAFSQSTTDIILTGKIFDGASKAPLVGVTVILKNTKTGTITDLDGAFRLILKTKDSAATVLVTFIGFESKELKIRAFTHAKTAENVFVKDIFLNENKHTLEEVVVVGYGKKSKKEVARSEAISKSAGKSLSKRKSTFEGMSAKPIAGALLGKVAGISLESSVLPSSASLIEDRREKSEIDKLYDYVDTPKMTEKRDVLKDNRAILVFAEDLVSIPEAGNFLQEIAKAKAMGQVEITGTKVLSEDEDIEPEPSAGQLTAGEWSDLKNWEFWKKSLNETFKTYANDWKMNFTQRYTLVLRGSNAQPIPDATVQLIAKEGTVIWSAKTDNNGRAELFANAFGKTNAVKISVQWGEKMYQLDKIIKAETGVNELKIPATCGFSPTVDMAFVVDATGSMGDEIAYLKAELADVIRQVKRDNQQLTVRLGSVFYRDFGDEYVTRTFPFDKSLKKNVEFIKNQSANGGGDTPEAVQEGLEAAIDSMAWSEHAVARLLFLVLDAPPHLTGDNVEKLHRLTAKAAAKGIRIIPIAASGVDQNTEFLMKAFAVATGGTYTFLTDDSGIGGGHLKATTEKHEVELLNALMVRLIKQYSSYEACNDLAMEAATGGDTKLGLNFKVFPNPVRDVLQLDLKTAVTDVFITNAQGQIVRKLGIYTEGVQSVDVSDFMSGIYFVHFQKEGIVCTKKISVVK